MHARHAVTPGRTTGPMLAPDSVKTMGTCGMSLANHGWLSIGEMTKLLTRTARSIRDTSTTLVETPQTTPLLAPLITVAMSADCGCFPTTATRGSRGAIVARNAGPQCAWSSALRLAPRRAVSLDVEVPLTSSPSARAVTSSTSSNLTSTGSIPACADEWSRHTSGTAGFIWTNTLRECHTATFRVSLRPQFLRRGFGAARHREHQGQVPDP
jgi:hypothetical protein